MKRKMRVSLMVAALILILLAAVALAATRWGVLDFFRLYEHPIEPLNEARAMIQSDLGSASNDRLRMTVREAVYDGVNARAVVAVAPAQDSGLILVDPWSRDELASGGDGAGSAIQEKAADTGKTPYPVDYPLLEGTARGGAFEPSGGDLYVSEGDSLLFCLSGTVEGAPGALRLTVSMPAPDDALRVSFDLAKTGRAKVAGLIPDEAERADAGCVILSATLHMTPLVGYAEITYAPKEKPPAQLTDNTPVYTTKNGKYFHRVSGCSGMENARTMTCGEAKTAGKKACPVCLSGKGEAPLLNFELLDASGADITGLEDGWSQSHETGDTGEVCRTVGIFQPSSDMPDAYYLRLYDSQTQERFEPVRCAVRLKNSD